MHQYGAHGTEKVGARQTVFPYTTPTKISRRPRARASAIAKPVSIGETENPNRKDFFESLFGTVESARKRARIGEPVSSTNRVTRQPFEFRFTTEGTESTEKLICFLRALRGENEFNPETFPAMEFSFPAR